MRIKLDGGAYQASSLIASAQACINLLPERLPADSGEPVTTVHNLTPGLTLLGNISGSPFRALFRSTQGAVFLVVGNTLYELVTIGPVSLLSCGTIATTTGPVSMADDGTTLILVDGTTTGYKMSLTGLVLAAIVDPNFYGGDTVAVLDGFFVVNRTGTSQWYISSTVSSGPGGPFNNPVTWNALDIVATNTADTLVGLIVTRRELWLFGRTRTEIWTNVGAADFPFQIASGGIDYGCIAPHTIRKSDGLVFWLSRSKDGIGMVMQGTNYEAKRISTHAIEAALRGYPTLFDAVAWVYQIRGHTVYVLTFPAANATWCYDIATGLWHQWQSSGGRYRGICHAESDFGGGYNLVGDYANGNLYALDPNAFTDNGAAIQRTRVFPHLVDDGDNRISYLQFIADMQTGTATGAAPTLTLDWSDDRGATFGTPITCSMGASGAAITSLQFRRLGMARDRVFRLTWNAPVNTSLLGAFVEVAKSST